MDRGLNNIFINESGEGLKYKPVSQPGGNPNFPHRRSRKEHGKRIESQFELAWKEAEASCEGKLAVSASGRDGVYLQIKGKAGYDLVTKSLEDARLGVRLANVQTVDSVILATVFIPNSKHDFFIKKIKKYMEKETGTDVIGTVENIQMAMVDAFWIGEKKSMPTESKPAWCEVWIRYDVKEVIENVRAEFFNVCHALEIKTKSQHITFPERMVV